MDFSIIKYLAGPIIGAVIGYFTNLIAVKMLFYPRKEVKLFGHRLPFTPGAIPRGKGRLAKAVGTAVGETLLTRSDIESKLISDEVSGKVADAVMGKLSLPLKEEIMDLASLSEESYEEKKGQAVNFISDSLINSLSKLNFSDILVETGSAAVKEKVKGTMLEMFLSDDLIRSVIGPVGTEVQKALMAKGPDLFRPSVEEKIEEIEEDSGLALLGKVDMGEERTREAIIGIYRKTASSGIDRLMETVDISGIVEKKIRDMKEEDLEVLVLSVMKKELNAIVNLGALIGFVLGLVNLLLLLA
ncbi:MAG: DUF445 family protein [Lachnospiraceae bacterium]|nr:DUF445 family protein [Lachnospiraceae bacterium]